ncbi:MAG: DUF481 domain-containing protein [Planctomycetota bacterium]|nr:DUF481 domain-containing protein [Planctomycetota bacterium]
MSYFEVLNYDPERILRLYFLVREVMFRFLPLVCWFWLAFGQLAPAQTEMPGEAGVDVEAGADVESGGWTETGELELIAPPSFPVESVDPEDDLVDPASADATDFLPPLDAPSPLFLLPMDLEFLPDYDSPFLPIQYDFDRAVTPEDLQSGRFQRVVTESDQSDETTNRTWRSRIIRRFSGLFDEWTSRISLGGRSLAGNSDQNFIDLIADFENKTPLRATQVNLGGQFGQSNDKVVANRWFANSTTDFYHGDKWLTFTKVMDQYDALQNLDYRGTFSAGIGYRFLFDDQRRIITRVGPGVTVESFHNPADTRTTPDLFAELELRLPLWKRLKWEQKSTVFPSLSELAVGRAQNQTSILYAFDERERWSLRVGWLYQYNSQPNVGKVPSDYTTNVSIMYQRK